jgi:predicted small secreted protein
MKKIISIILVLVFCLCFTACGGAGTGKDENEAQVNDTTSAAPEADNAETDNADVEAPTEESEAASDVVGEYYAFAMERDGYCVASPEFGESKDGMITLNEDGTGTWQTGDIVNNLKWILVGDTLIFTEESGLMTFPATIKLH